MFGRFGSRALALTSLLTLAFAGTATAAQPRVDLGTAESYAVLAGSEVTNSGASIVTGDLGLSPGTSVSGFGGAPDGTVFGEIHIADSAADQAKLALGSAHTDAAGRTPAIDVPSGELGGSTLTPGVYNSASTLGLTGNVTLDALGDPNAVFIFQVGSGLTTATDSSVTLIGAAQACNVYWQVGSSATLGTRTDFRGTIMAAASISAGDSVNVIGRLLAGSGAVTLLNDTITRSDCATPASGGTTTPGSGGGAGAAVGPGSGAALDRRGPSIGIFGLPGVRQLPVGRPGDRRPRRPARSAVCTTRSFTARVRLSDRSKIRKVNVYLDGKLIKRTSLSRFSLRINVRGLRVGAHRITVVARDRAGNRSVARRRFGRCALAVAAPRFTG